MVGLGIVIIDGLDRYSTYSWGVYVAAPSSFVLEWVAKFLALLLLLTAGYDGHICFFCIHMSTLVCEGRQWQ